MSETRIGQAKTVIVYSQGEASQAAITSVSAKVRSRGPGDRLGFAGSVDVESKTQKHLLQNVLPLVDQILEGLGLPANDYMMDFQNLGFASAKEVPLLLTGFSADTAAFLAILSASLGLGVNQNIVSTGHIASQTGSLSLVRSIPEKLKAAVQADLNAFIYPSFEIDSSLAIATPREKKRIEEAISRWKGEIRCLETESIAGLIKFSVDEESLVLAALGKDFFEYGKESPAGESPICEIIEFLTKDNQKRFWDCLQKSLMNEECDRAKQLLWAWADFHIRHNAYPDEIGLRLAQLVNSLPPRIRRKKNIFPLLDPSRCQRLSHRAKAQQFSDVRMLLNAVQGEATKSHTISRHVEEKSDSENRENLKAEQDTLAQILSEIDPKTLSERVGLPIDQARLSFIIDSPVIESAEEFYEILSAFLLHVCRHTNQISGKADEEALADAALDILERSFSREGGVSAAIAEARNGTRGGMRHILDRLTETIKKEEYEKRVARILRQQLDPLDWSEKVAFAKSFISRMSPGLEAELAEKNVEQCAHYVDALVRVWIDSMEEVKNLLRTF